jgi:flagellar assembly protein FliH
MDSEIRKLTYVPHSNGAKPGRGLPESIGLPLDELPFFLHKDDTAKSSAKLRDVRLEARILEFEREREENERRHREVIAGIREAAAQELTAALERQQETLKRESVLSVQTAIAAFQERQDRYFAEAEAAVVRLALSIAARVLHREAQLDPLLLRGPVRVALEDAQQGAVCVLEVSATEAEAWEKWLAEAAVPVRVQVRTRDEAEPGLCRLEIGASMADLSVHAQLAEIERGFFDLLQDRLSPGNRVLKAER